jgi:hypothetical protein
MTSNAFRRAFVAFHRVGQLAAPRTTLGCGWRLAGCGWRLAGGGTPVSQGPVRMRADKVVSGDELEGTLRELPSGRLVRRATARRAPKPGSGPTERRIQRSTGSP